MAKAKRANHRSGSERPRWSLDGTAEDLHVDESDWDPDDTEERRVLGSDDHTGSPDQPGRPDQNGPGQNGPGQNGQGPSGPGQSGQGQNGQGQNGRGNNNVQNGNGGSAGPKVQDSEPGAGRQASAGQNGAADMSGSSAASVDQPGDQNTRGARNPRGGNTRGSKPRGGSTRDSEKPQDASGGESNEGGQNGQNLQAGQDVRSGQNGQVRAGGQPRVAEFGTPVRVDKIALAAKALSDELHTATQGLSESVESRQFRRDLAEAADTFRSVASELETTAGNLIRLAATEGQSCGVSWGVCPLHGLTLMNVGEVVTCHVLGCHLESEEVVERCSQPVAYKVVDAAGPALLTCAGHAIACRLHLEGAVITLASDSLELL